MSAPTNFSQLQLAYGLSNKEAANYHAVSESTVEKWRSVSSAAPREAIERLATLDMKLQELAENHAALILTKVEEVSDAATRTVVPISIYPDDETFRQDGPSSEGFPFNSTHLALCRRVASELRGEGVSVMMVDYLTQHDHIYPGKAKGKTKKASRKAVPAPNNFTQLQLACGLSNKEAANYLAVSESTIQGARSSARSFPFDMP